MNGFIGCLYKDMNTKETIGVAIMARYMTKI